MKLQHILCTTFILSALVGCKPQSSTTRAQSLETGGGAAASSEHIFGGWTSSRLPLTISVSGDFTSGEKSSLVSGANKWETTANRNFINFSGGSISNKDLNSMNSYLDGSIEVHQVNTNALPSSSLAVTVFNGTVLNSGTSSEYIRLNDADILFNYNDFVFSTSPVPGEFDLESVMIHEVGHLLGLNHISPSVGNSIMNPSFSSGTTKRNLFSVDSGNIKLNYPSSGLSTGFSIGFAVTAGSGADQNVPEGEIVSGYFELSADKTCTHVINGKVVHQHKADIH